MPDILEARFRIVTPMFLGGANQDTADGIRPPSVKGALRFWWRALNWGRFRTHAADAAAALRALHREEARLFGSAADEDGTGGQGAFLIRVTHDVLTSTGKDQVHPVLKSKAAARYLGYGLMEAFQSRVKGTAAGQLTRACLNEGQTFTITFLFRCGVDPSVQDALIAWGLLGGLGSRSRHGYGSVALESITMGGRHLWSAPADTGSYHAAVAGLLAGRQAGVTKPPFTAISTDTRIDILYDKQASPFDALNVFGHALLMYRSWGKDGKVLEEDSERRFLADHDWSKKKRPKDFHPQRVIFGLPHNYGKTEDMKITPADHDRRASPLLFHVHSVGTTFLGITALLPAMFLPNDEKINAGGTMVPSNPDWLILTGFLDGHRASDGKPRFASKITI